MSPNAATKVAKTQHTHPNSSSNKTTPHNNVNNEYTFENKVVRVDLELHTNTSTPNDNESVMTRITRQQRINRNQTVKHDTAKQGKKELNFLLFRGPSDKKNKSLKTRGF